MRKLLLILIVAVVSLSPAMAGVRTSSSMRSVAAQRLGTSSQVEQLAAAPGYAVYGAPGHGFVVVSTDDAQSAVLAYSSHDIDASAMPPSMHWLLSQLNAPSRPTTTVRRVARVTKVVEPLLTTKWGQEDPYNIKCPEVNDVPAPTGCMATAMAQTLKFFEYPVQGQGSGVYFLGESSSEHPADIATTYDWANMLDSYIPTDDHWFFTKAEKNAVANLMYDCGLASKMRYGALGSSATPFDASYGFVTNFGMDPLALKCEIGLMVGSDYDTWIQRIYDELAANRPVIYCGADPDYGGHAFVLDGVDADGLVHVNWGWEGNADAYFDITNLNPAGILGSEDTYHFDYSHFMIRGFRCNPEPEPGAEFHSQWAMSAVDLLGLSEDAKELSINFGDLYNASFMPFTGYVGLIVEVPDDPSQDNLLPLSNTFHFTNLPALQGLLLGEGELVHHAAYTGSELLNDYGLRAGVDYHVFIGSWYEGEEDRGVPAIYPGGVSNYTLRINADGTMVLTENTEPQPQPALKGDVNNDGAVSSADLAIVVNIIAGLDNAEDYDGRANVNGDSEVTSADIAAIVNILAGLD